MKKVAVVTGAAKGLGAEIAEHLAKIGYVVVVHYRSSKEDAQKVLGEIKIHSRQSSIIRADLTVEGQVRKMFGDIISKYGQIDLLVNNVGNFIYKAFNKTENNEFRNIVESNIYATLYASRAVLPLMRKQKSGHIINIGAVGAERLIIRENSMPYFLGKTGIYVLTKTMAWEEARNGIHINMISPASLATDIFSQDDFPMGREAQYKDVLSVVDFLTSDAAYYINGANIEVAGAFVPGMDKPE